MGSEVSLYEHDVDVHGWVVHLQESLHSHGYDPGEHDGWFGPRTLAAVVSFQRDRRAEATGVVGDETWSLLLRREREPPHVNNPPHGDTRDHSEARPDPPGNTDGPTSQDGTWVDDIRLEITHIRLGYEPDGHHVELHLSRTGTGIPQAWLRADVNVGFHWRFDGDWRAAIDVSRTGSAHYDISVADHDPIIVKLDGGDALPPDFDERDATVVVDATVSLDTRTATVHDSRRETVQERHPLASPDDVE